MTCSYFAVLRHGHADNNHAEELYRNGDTAAFNTVTRKPSSLHDLTERGIKEAIKVGAWLTTYKLNFDHHIVSGYLRALHTATLLGIKNAQWRIEDRLCEKDGGILNEMTPPEVEEYFLQSRQRRHDRDNYRFRPQNGESFLDVETRVRPVIKSLEDRTLIVCHGHLIRVIDRIIMRGQCSWDFGSFKDTRGDLPNGVLIEYKYQNDVWNRRASVPTRNLGMGGWELIKPPLHSNEDLKTLIEKVSAL